MSDDGFALKAFGAILAVLVLAAILYYVYQNLPSVRDMIGGVGSIGKEIVGGVVDVVKKPVMAVVAPVAAAAATVYTTVVPAPVRALVPRSLSDVTSMPGRVISNPLGSARALAEASPAGVAFRQISSRVPLPTPRVPAVISRPISRITKPIASVTKPVANVANKVISVIPKPSFPKLRSPF